MMSRSLSAITATLLVLASSVGTFAQTPAPAPSIGPPAGNSVAAPNPQAAPAASDVTKAGLPKMKVVRDQCRVEVKAQRLKGDARRQAMSDCIVKERPDQSARLKCASDPQARAMAKDARRAFVKECVAKTKG